MRDLERLGNQTKKKEEKKMREKKKMEMPGFDPGTFRMLSGRDTNFATPPFELFKRILLISPPFLEKKWISILCQNWTTLDRK